MAAELTAAFDPTRADAPARRRVLDTVRGLDPAQPLASPEPCPGLAIPVWRRLAAIAPDWLLPGVGELGEDSVIALGTNPVFVDALLTGLNHKLLEEARWRNLRVATGCTPVRTFWFRADGTGGDLVDDVVGIQRWPTGSELGDPSHRPTGLTGADLVLVFRGRLFERYPDTLLYLVSDPDDAEGTLPTFQGRIGADVTYFGFVGVDPESVTGRWVVLEEPPSGVRFRNDAVEADNAADGAEFATAAFDDPVRVLIDGAYLVPGAGS
jgi:hypothetical protein